MYGRVAGLCLATTLFICGVAGFPTAPSSVPASSGALILSQTGGAGHTFAPGATIEISGRGFAPTTPVTVAVYSQPESLAQTAAGSRGDLDVTVTLPTTLAPGHHTLAALGASPRGVGIALIAHITVATAAQAAGAPAQLAWTGFNVLAYVITGLVLIVAGLLLFRTAGMRRRLLPLAAAAGSSPAARHRQFADGESAADVD